jgi:hypothetical protein
VNARKPPVRVWQLSNSAAAGDGVIGFRLIGGDEVFVCQIDGADRDPQREGYYNTVGTTNFKVITLWVIADPRFDLPQGRRPPSAESGNWKLKIRQIRSAYCPTLSAEGMRARAKRPQLYLRLAEISVGQSVWQPCCWLQISRCSRRFARSRRARSTKWSAGEASASFDRKTQPATAGRPLETAQAVTGNEGRGLRSAP